jgi:hypothetical protein
MPTRIRDERGAAAFLVAVSLLLLVGFAALAIDGGLGFDQRRGTQNASDNAALAAAWEACNPSGGTTPTAAALAVAAQNGYDDNEPDVVVTVNALGATEYEVIIQQVNDTTFAGPGVAADTLTVVSQAVATCEQEPFLGGYAIFAGADSCASGGSIELDLTGATKTITGGIFSNGDLKINGPNTTIIGNVEYRGDFNTNVVGVTAEKVFGSPKDYPLTLDIAEFRPGGPRATADPGNYFNSAPGTDIDNNWMVSRGYATGNNANIVITQPGIYYSPKTGNDAINLKGVSAPGVAVTFVSEGQIQIVGDANITGYAPVNEGAPSPYSPLILFSNAQPPGSCSTNAIQFSGSSMTWTGLIYAPNGEVQMSASSSDATVNGSIIGHSVNISGSDFQINWQDDSSGSPRFKVELQS